MPSKLVRSLSQITPAEQGGVLTIGNFDGVHRGHQQLLQQVVEKAAMLGVPSMVMTFEPHPYEFFSQDKLTIPRLTRLREKFTLLAACGIDNVLIVEFNQQVADISASAFLDDVVRRVLRPQHIIVGDDFRFGHKRQGDFSMLVASGEALGFGVTAMQSVLADDDRVSSTRVRQALALGDHELANRLLGRPYTMQGRVAHGDELGRQLGFRTANIHLHRRLSPVQGVYAVLVHGLGERPLPGAANVGTRPTVDGTRALLEVHLLDFNQDIYGRHVTVQFCKKLREEERYDTLEALRVQIAADVAETRVYFQEQGAL